MEYLRLCFYGFGVEVKSADLKILEDIKRDYSFFEKKECGININIEVFGVASDYKNLPNLLSSVHTPRNIRYNHGDISYIDYFSKGLLIIDHKTHTYKVYSEDKHLRHEIVFLTIMSLSAEYLDHKALHRVHGLGIDLKGRGVLVLLPQGGGKTTLLLEILRHDKSNIKLISEDSPLISKTGNIFPFPLRIGVSSRGKIPEFPDKYVRLVKRMEFEPKYLIDIEAFNDKISKNPSLPWIILVGKRTLGSNTEIKPFSKYRALMSFIKDSVIGVGLYQGVEFILKNSIFELLKKIPVFISRLRNACIVIFKSKTYLFIVGSDKKKNKDTLLKFLNI